MYFPSTTQNRIKLDMSSNDLIIDNGFAVLNDFKPGVDNDDDNSKPTTLPRFPFASYADAFSISSDELRASFLNDCSLVFTARTKEDSDGYSTGSTFFLPCLMKPRCALEALAQTIFRAHVDPLGKCAHEDKGGKSELVYDPERSGAEWWTLVLDVPSVGESQSGEVEDEENNGEGEDDEVGIHFDADYGECLGIALGRFSSIILLVEFVTPHCDDKVWKSSYQITLSIHGSQQLPI